jgi:hypothetical protein
MFAAQYAIPNSGSHEGVADEPHILQAAGQRFEFRIPLPDEAWVGDDRANSYEGILWYMVHSTGNVNQIKVEVSINGKLVNTYGPTSTDLTRPFHEIVNKGILQKGLNKVMFNYISGQGKFQVSDIIVFFMVH